MLSDVGALPFASVVHVSLLHPFPVIIICIGCPHPDARILVAFDNEVLRYLVAVRQMDSEGVRFDPRNSDERLVLN